MCPRRGKLNKSLNYYEEKEDFIVDENEKKSIKSPAINLILLLIQYTLQAIYGPIKILP